jgi:hypothetical protein
MLKGVLIRQGHWRRRVIQESNVAQATWEDFCSEVDEWSVSPTNKPLLAPFHPAVDTWGKSRCRGDQIVSSHAFAEHLTEKYLCNILVRPHSHLSVRGGPRPNTYTPATRVQDPMARSEAVSAVRKNIVRCIEDLCRECPRDGHEPRSSRRFSSQQEPEIISSPLPGVFRAAGSGSLPLQCLSRVELIPMNAVTAASNSVDGTSDSSDQDDSVEKEGRPFKYGTAWKTVREAKRYLQQRTVGHCSNPETEGENNKTTPWTCALCTKSNPSTSSLCAICGRPADYVSTAQRQLHTRVLERQAQQLKAFTSSADPKPSLEKFAKTTMKTEMEAEKCRKLSTEIRAVLSEVRAMNGEGDEVKSTHRMEDQQ